jgi:protein SCO1/2
MNDDQPKRKPPLWGTGYWRVLVATLAFFGVAAAVFVISDRYAAKTASGFPNLQDYDFTLTDQYGAPTGPDRFAGRPLALFFGFTFCPDICPTTLTMLAAARDELAAGGTDMSSLKIAFVTVDPERDTPQQLGQYLGLFDLDVVGLTGDLADVRAVLKQFGIYAKKVDHGDGDYLYDHSAAVYLYRADGRFKGTIVHNEPPEFIAEKLKSLMR